MADSRTIKVPATLLTFTSFCFSNNCIEKYRAQELNDHRLWRANGFSDIVVVDRCATCHQF